MPNKPIKRITYTLLNKTITLENYSSYNHFL
jgi:hypothetical protein